MQPPRTTTSQHYPDFIRDNKALKRFDRESIFPSIGLRNNSKKVGDLTVVFSATGNRALWDIATMSMRGISSCQSWGGSLIHCKRLVGSMLDGCCGIIYTTAGQKTSLGQFMECRAIVRFIVSQGRSREPAIMIERIYGPWSKQIDAGCIFTRYIAKKTKYKYSVVYSAHDYVVPMTKPVRSIPERERSYRDSGIVYSRRKVYTMKELEALV